MKTQIKRMGDIVVVNLEGRLNFENQEPLREDLGALMKKVNTDETPRKIIFNLENLEFVGSSGISNFIQTLRDFNVRASLRPKYCNVKSEFKRIIKAFDEENIFEIHDNEERAKKSFDQ